MTDRFTRTARLMAEVCGVPTYPFAVVPHPISSNTDAELREKAAEAVRQFRRAVELLPGKVEPYNWLGRTLIGIGQAEQGRKALDEVKRLKAAEHERLPDIRTRPSGGADPGNSQ